MSEANDLICLLAAFILSVNSKFNLDYFIL